MKKQISILFITVTALSLLLTTNTEAKQKLTKVKLETINTPAKIKPNDQIVSGKQYTISNGVAQVVADNTVMYKSCDEVNCDEVQSSIKNILDVPNEIVEKGDVGRDLFMPVLEKYERCISKYGVDNSTCKENLDKETREAKISTYRRKAVLLKLAELVKDDGFLQSTKTDFDGNYSFRCASKQCLVLSIAQTKSNINVWIKVIKSDVKKHDLTTSSAIYTF
jgi:hypothetical protein